MLLMLNGVASTMPFKSKNATVTLPPLSDTIASACCDLDATIADSYPGTGTAWLNLIETPADSAAQSDYDFIRTTAASFFNGAAGDSGAYWSFDGSSDNLFYIRDNTNTALLENAHKTSGSDFWIAIAGRTQENSGSGIFGTQTNTAGAGLGCQFDFEEKFQLQHNTGSMNNVEHTHRETYANGTDFLAVFSHDHATNTTRLWVNGDLYEDTQIFTDTTAAPDIAHIGGQISASYLQSGFRLYAVAIGNEFITNAQEAALRAAYESRHARSYTDVTVNSFDFVNVLDAETATLTSSGIVEVTGFAGPVTVSISGNGSPQYRICDDNACSVVTTDWTNSATEITYGSGQYVQMRLTSSNTEETALSADLTIGDVTADWSVTTGAAAADDLSSVEASTCCDLDATKSSSYGGSGQTWANLVASPADSASQTDYDFYLGSTGSSSSNDPTFNGTAGNSDAYFSTDGGDYFRIQTTSGTLFSTASMTSGTGSGPRWICMAFRTPATLGSNKALFGNASAAGEHGIRLLWTSAGELRFLQAGLLLTYNQIISGSGLFTANTDYMLLLTFDSTNPGSEKFWLNSTTGTNWSAAYNPQSSGSQSSNAMDIAASEGAFIQNNDFRLYHLSAGNSLLNDTKAAAIIAELELRHGRDYTP